MLGKALQVLGVVAIVGAAAVTVAGFALLPDRVHVTIQGDQPATVEPMALLRDDLRAQQRDLEALTRALGDNFVQLQRQLAEQLQQGATVADGRARELQAAQAELQQRLAALDARVQALATTVQESAARAAAAAPMPVALREPPSEPVLAPKSEAAATPIAAPAEPVAAPPAAKPAVSAKGFLGFQLPDRTFAFDKLQQFEIVPELSRVGFDAKSTLHDFSGVTKTVGGTFAANLADANGGWTGSVHCDAATLLTGVDGRDVAMREHLDTEHHARIEFAIAGFTPAANGIDARAQVVRGEVRGTMTIRGTARELKLPVTVTIDDGKRAVIEGQAPLKLSDYGVPVPNQLGLVKVQDEVVIWIALRARVRAGGADAR